MTLLTLPAKCCAAAWLLQALVTVTDLALADGELSTAKYGLCYRSPTQKPGPRGSAPTTLASMRLKDRIHVAKAACKVLTSCLAV